MRLNEVWQSVLDMSHHHHHGRSSLLSLLRGLVSEDKVIIKSTGSSYCNLYNDIWMRAVICAAGWAVCEVLPGPVLRPAPAAEQSAQLPQDQVRGDGGAGRGQS